MFVALPADNEVKLPIFETVLNGITIGVSIVSYNVIERPFLRLKNRRLGAAPRRRAVPQEAEAPAASS